MAPLKKTKRAKAAAARYKNMTPKSKERYLSKKRIANAKKKKSKTTSLTAVQRSEQLEEVDETSTDECEGMEIRSVIDEYSKPRNLYTTRRTETPSDDHAQYKASRLESARSRMQKKRNNETPNTREKRLKNMREKAKQKKVLESPTKRELRLQKRRKSEKDKLAKETPNTRKRRLKNIKDSQREKLAEETPNTRKRRLKNVKDSQREKLAKETPNTRKRRLENVKDLQRQKLAKETPNTRKQRLENLRYSQRERLVEETPTTRSRRLQNRRIREKDALAREGDTSREIRLSRNRIYNNFEKEMESPASRQWRLSLAAEQNAVDRSLETPQSRQARISNERNRISNLSPVSRSQHLSRRRLARQISATNFENEINQFMDQECEVCTKMCYPKQVSSLELTESMKQLVFDFRGVPIVCCNRCKTWLQKGKLLPTAKINNMTVAPCPKELENLTELEIRLLSRITPFIKIIRLGGRFGQYGFKGQAVLFAQEIEEIAEQLPLSAEKSGIAIVAETLENVNYFKQFTVDIDRMKIALEWLMAKNHLYRNIEVNFDHIDRLVEEICTIENNKQQTSNSLPIQHQTDFQSRYKPAGEGKFILRGHFHQGSDKFSDPSRGLQCSAIAATAIAYSSEKRFCDWDPNDINRVVMTGDFYYKTSMELLDPRPERLDEIHYLKNELTIASKTYGIESSIDNTVLGYINPTNSEELRPSVTTSLRTGLEKLFDHYHFDCGVIFCNDISVSVRHEDNFYWLFDSHSRGPKGFVGRKKGTAMVMRFETTETLSNHLTILFEVKKKKDVFFQIVYVNITKKNEELQPVPMAFPVQASNSPTQPRSHFRPISEGKRILHGTFHQGCPERFSAESFGRQCTTIAAAAIAYSSKKRFRKWRPDDIDLVLMAGDEYYKQCVRHLDPKPHYLEPTELLEYFEINEKEYYYEALTMYTAFGLINPGNPEEMPEEYAKSLLDGLNNFFSDDESVSGIITCSEISLAIVKQDQYFWLFDSHSRNAEGYISENGKAILLQCNSIALLSDHLLMIYDANNKTDLQFILEKIEAGPRNVEFDQDSLASEGLQNAETVFSAVDSMHETPFLANPLDFFPSSSSFYGQDLFEPNVELVEGSQDINFIETSAFFPIDISLPQLSQVLENDVAPEETIPIYDLKRKTAPPISLLREKRVEELCWFPLFPDGKNGFGEDRPIKMTPLDYFQNRVMGSDTRFQRNDYLFYALSAVELYKAQQNVSVCARLRQGNAQPQDVLQNVHLSMRNIRGSSSYWHKNYRDLMAMVKNLGPPSWYITLSCNDLNWPDMLKAFLKSDNQPEKNPDELSFTEKVRLVETYPVTLSKQFMFRFNALMKLLKNDNDMLGGPITDYWWRIEFQLRGSPHVHMVVWCQNLPDFDTPAGIEIIDRVATCAIPKDDEQLKDLVMKCQTHRHTHTCFKKQDQNTCRFQYPRPVSRETTVLGPDEAIRQGGRFCIFKRNEEERYINTYNPEILKLWKANIDIQPCGSAIGVAYYISKYVAKCEPIDITRGIRNALQRISERGGDLGQKIFAVQMAILNHRQVSAAECAFRLCHLRLKEGSRATFFVNTCRPELRYRMLRLDTEDPEPFMNIFDRYAHRPLDLEELSLGEFAVRYEYSSKKADENDDEDGDQDAYLDEERPGQQRNKQEFIKLLDNKGMMKKRVRAGILRTRYFSEQSDPDAYYYGLLLTHLPFRSETELEEGYTNSKEAFFAKKDLLRPLQGLGAEAAAAFEAEIQAAIKKIVAERLLEESSNENGDNTEDGHQENLPFLRFDNDEDMVYEARDVEDLDEFVENDELGMSDEEYQNRMRSTNILQRRLIKKIGDKVKEQQESGANKDPVKIFVTGGAGSGKTFVLKLIVETIRRLCPLEAGRKPVLVGAPTGVAARLINGVTLHSLLPLPIERGNQTAPFQKLKGDRLQRERHKWVTVKWLIIDEISMVSYKVLRMINLRLQEFIDNTLPFGGLNVLFFGDLMQLPPVSKLTGGSYCFKQPEDYVGEPHLWQMFSFCELTANMRQGGVNEFVDLLNCLRIGELTLEQLQILDDRRLPLTGDFADGKAIRIFPTVKQVDAYNAFMAEKLSDDLVAQGKKLYKIKAIDTSCELKTFRQKPPEDCVPKDPNKTGGLPGEITLAEGARVMLRRNINISKGLVNGAMGIVTKIQWSALRRDQMEAGELPDSIYVKFDDPSIPTDGNGWTNIQQFTATFDGLKGYGKIERRTIPVILCWAVTVHKLQGTTLDKAVVDLGPQLFAKGQAYVAISRVRSLDGLVISNMAPNRLLFKPHDETSLEELQRLRSLPDF